MFKYIFASVVGYLLGSLSPAALISKIKQKNIRNSGTGNLGATNVMLNFGKGFGALVMLFDIAKSVLAYKVAELVFPSVYCIGLLAGVSAVVGHIFPFYLGFKGGKGLASFGGVVLAYDWILFLFLLITGCIIMLLVNYSYVLPFYAALAFPLHVIYHERNIFAILIAAGVSFLMIAKFQSNYVKAKKGKDTTIRDHIKNIVK